MHEGYLPETESKIKHYEYFAPPGSSISHIEFIVANDSIPGNTSEGFAIDNIAWGENVDSGLESFDQYAVDFKFDMSQVNTLWGGVKFSGKAHEGVVSNIGASKVHNDNDAHRAFVLGDNSTYTYDFGSTEKVEFALSAVHSANQHEVIVYSTTGEILYREMIATVGSRTTTPPDTYQFIAPPGKKIGHIDLVLGQKPHRTTMMPVFQLTTSNGANTSIRKSIPTAANCTCLTKRPL